MKVFTIGVKNMLQLPYDDQDYLDLNRIDVDLSQESLLYKELPPHEISLFEDQVPDYGVEAFKALLPTIVKNGKLFKIKTLTKEPLKSLLILRQFTQTAFIPLVTTSTEVMEEVITFFGYATYNRMMYNYIYPRLFRYKNPYVPGSKMLIKRSDSNKYKEEVGTHLPKLAAPPYFVVKNRRNTIFDFSEIINLSMPNKAMVNRPYIIPVSDKLPLQMISRLGFKVIEEEQGLYTHYKCPLPPAGELFNSLIFTIKVKATDLRLANQFLNINQDRIPNMVRKNAESIFLLGIIRFLLKLIDNHPFDGASLEQQLANLIKQKSHAVFIFHNDTHAFYLDPLEIKEREIKYNNLFTFIKLSLKTLISLNNKTITPLDVDTETELSPEEAEKILDRKIAGKAEVLEQAVQEINAEGKDETLAALPQELAKIIKTEKELPPEPEVKKLIAQGKSNIIHQKALGLDTAEKNKKIDKISYDQKEPDVTKLAKLDEEEEEPPKEESQEEEIDEFFQDIEEEQGSTPEEQEEADREEEEEAKEFLDELAEENSEEAQRKFIEQIKSSTRPPQTAAEKRRLEAVKNKYKSIHYEDDRTLDEIIADTSTHSIDINKSASSIKDDSFNYSVLKDFTASYVNKTMSRDIVKTVKFFSETSSLPMHITGFKKQDISDQFNSVSTYTFSLEDEHKQKHKIKFKLPNINEDGFMYINGNKKFLKKQFILRPVTKTKEDEVYLTSDFNKVCLFRQGSVLNRNTTIVRKVLKTIQDAVKADPKGELARNIDILRGNNALVNSDYITTIEYDELAAYLHHISLFPGTKNEVSFYFNQSNIRDEIKKLGIEYAYSASATPIGIIKSTKTVIEVKSLDSTDSVAEKILNVLIKSEILPNIQTIIESSKVPKRRMYTRMEIQSKDTPLIVYLASIYTFSKVIEVAGIETYFVKGDEPIPAAIDVNFVSVDFADGTLYYNQYPIENALLLNGLNELHDTSEMAYAELDNVATYLDWMYDVYKTRNLYKGWTAFHELFLNPKTIECLEALQQPTDFLELFLYANGLLANNTYLDSAEAQNWRIRDYEIFNSLLYYSVSHAYANYKQKGKSRAGFSIPEDEVINEINKNFVTANYDSTNPLNELRERSSVTYKGPRGINLNRAFTLDKRGQTRSTVGTIGISSVDKGNVGIVKQLTINPRIISTLGFIDSPSTDKDVGAITTSSLMTAEESMLPFVNRDDPKRIGFASGQTKHVIPADHFTPQVIGTGFEQSIIYKISNDFGYKARQDGQIVAVNKENHFAVVKYKDNSTARIEFGEQYHRNSDFFLSNNLELAVKEGDFVKKGELITYNKDFFKKHMGKLMYTQGAVARIAITEGEVTEEDSSGITQRLANKLNSTVIKRKQIVLGVNANIIRSVSKGDHVVYGDPLLVFEDQKDTNSDTALLALLGEVNEKTLDAVSRHKASADFTGEIIDMKVYWTVNPDHMSESCATFVKKYMRSVNKQISFEEAATKVGSRKKIETQVTLPYRDRINGMEIPREGGILVEYYVKHSAGKRGGDKLTMNSSLKTIICQVIPDELAPRRLNGRFKQIDMIFSFIGINARQVSSVWFAGFTAKIIVEEGKKFAEEFFKELEIDPTSIMESSLVPLEGWNG
jgi:hypothetical protein